LPTSHLRCLQRALNIHEDKFGKEDPKLASLLNNLGLLYSTQGKYKEAETLMKRTLVINEKALGKDHPTVARTLRNYAALLRKTKREQEAKVLETKAKAILGKTKNGGSKT